MTRLIKAQIALEERRRELGALLDQEERADDYADKLDAAKRAVQAAQEELAAAALVEEETPPEHRQDTPQGAELRSMLERADVGNIFAAVLEKRSTDGVEKELQDHYGIAAHAVPLEMLETRAVTPAPANEGVTQAAIVQPIFHDGDANFLSVDLATVPVGAAVYPVLTTRPTVGGPHTDSTAVAETTGAFTAEMLEPARLQASFFYRRTDAARFAGMGEALRQALSSGLSEALDAQIIAQIIADVSQTTADAVDSFASYRKRLVYDQIEGRFASMEGDMRLLMGAPTLAHASGLYRTTTTDESAVDTLRRITGGVRVSPHIAAVAANKQDAIVRRGTRRDAVAALWQGVSLIPDEVSKASTGEVVITAILMYRAKVIRAGGFARVQAQHA